MPIFGWLRRGANTEVRSGYTDALVTLAAANAAGAASTSQAAESTAVEFAVGKLAMCFATAELTPAILGPEALARLARCLLLSGNAVYAIDVDREGALRLLPAASWDISGGPLPESWRYQLDLSGPSRVESRRLPAEAVVHVRIGADEATPWRGVSPLLAAGISTQLLARLESAFRDESGARSGFLLPIPDGLADDVVDGLKADLAAMKGNVGIVETTSSGAGQGRANAPINDWTPKRFGATFPQHNVELRRDVAANVCSALQIPPVLYAGGDGGQMREGYRQLLVASVQPLARIILEELSAKLERPIEVNFRRLAAADIAARARAFGSLVTAGLEPPEAKVRSGLDGLRLGNLSWR